MLGKLMKYEIKATARTFLPLYGALIILALLNKIFYSFDGLGGMDNIYLQRFSEIPQFMATMAYILIIVAIFVITMIVMIQRFYKNLLGDEGYLMFTLPVQPWMNIITKLVVSMMWIVLSSIATAISIAILAAGKEMTEFFRLVAQTFPEFEAEFEAVLQISWTHFVVLMVIVGVVSLIVSVLQVYAAIAVGQLFNSHKLLASFGAYVVINMVMQAISAFIMILVTMLYPIDVFTLPQYLFRNTMWISIVLSVVYGAIFYVGTHLILSKKLNLE